MSNKIDVAEVAKMLPIFTTVLENHEEFNKYLKEVILEHRQNNPQTTESNVKAWHSSWITDRENPKFQPLVDIVLQLCTFTTAGYYQCKDVKYQMTNFWAMMYEEGEHAIRHAHSPSDYSACYYVDVDPGCAPIIFEPACDNLDSPPGEPYILQPQNGLLALWPSIIHHMVPPTKGRRMCISMNMDKGEGK